MTKLTMAAMVVALAGCAGARTMGDNDFAARHWTGEIDRHGSAQPLVVDIERKNGSYRGQVRSAAGFVSRPLENVQVHGDKVSFETNELRFVGELKGSTLAGQVSEKPEGAPVGQFSVTEKDRAIHYSPASEWSPFEIE